MRAKILYVAVALAMALSLVAVAVPMTAATPMTTPAEAAGTTWYVNVSGDNSNSGLGPGPDEAWRDIQYAIGNVSVDPGDTIIVGNGTYNEDVTIEQVLTLNGAQAGVDARGRTGPESEIVGSITVSSGVRDVTIDGFKVTGTGVAPLAGVCMRIESASSTIKNNIVVAVEAIPGYTYSGFVDFAGITNALVEQNTFSGVYEDDRRPNVIRLGIAGAGGAVTVRNNEMHDVGGGGGIGIMSSSASAVISITGNVIENTGDGIWVYNSLFSALSITGNDIYNCGYNELGTRMGSYMGIKVVGGVTGSIVVGPDNNIYDNEEQGVYVGAPDVDITIQGNAIYNNGAVRTNIHIDVVRGTVVIDDNDISSSSAGPGIYIGSIESTGPPWARTFGSVAISNNDVEDNAGDGIYVYRVASGCTLMIGPDNNIVGNDGDGIEINWGDMGAIITIDRNTIDDNGANGIELGINYVDGATISWNTITNNYVGIYLSNYSAHNAIINNVITDNNVGIELSRWSHHNGIVGNLIAGNGHGIWVEGYQNDILSNVITGNVEIADSGVHFGPYAYDNVLNHNNIVGNSDTLSYGVFNENEEEMVDARWNWWGDDSGPYHRYTNPTGQGDSVSNYVDYSGYVGTAFPYVTMPYDADAPDILTTAAMPDMHSWYSILEEYTGEWIPPFQFEEEFGFTPGPVDGMYLVETTDILGDGAQPRGIRYVTLDLKDAVAQLMGVQDVWDVQPPEWVKPWNQEEWLAEWYWYVSMVNYWEQMEFEKECERPVWYKEVFLEFTFNMLYWLYFDESAGYSKLMEMLQPGEFHIGVTVEDWAGNTVEGTIEVALVDIAIPLEQGWNLRSTPIDLGVDTWGGITHLGGDLEAYMGSALEYEIAYRWDPVAEDWVQLLDGSILRPLEGIAIKATGRDALGLIFDRDTTAMPTLDVHEGWNLIGLAVGPSDDPWMPVDDALISIEEIRDGVRGYIIVESPQQYLQYEEQWHWCGEWQVAEDYHWYFGQQGWTYWHPADEVVEPVPDMTIGGAYWVFMEREDVLAGFSSTPVFLKLLQIERGEDLADVPRYPATTMVWYEDWTDYWALGYEIESRYGLQFVGIEYKGAFSPDDVIAFYEEQMPLYGWQMGSKFDLYGEIIGIGFWKEAEHGGVPYYTDVCRILAWEENDIGYIEVFYTPVDVPTVPGTALILWESMWPSETMYLEYQGSGVPLDVIDDFTEAVSKLQWELHDLDVFSWAIFADFEKPVITPWGGLEWMYLDVDIWFEGPPFIEQPVTIEIERRWQD